MSRILLLGGYGGFGGRIARRLAAAGHEVLVAGRSIDKARAFCGDAPSLMPLALDRSRIATALEEHRPDIVVDASGPFQAMDHAIAKACIAAGVHYVDIADSRDFVCGIGALDDAARAAGVILLSGASSVPALSGAAVRHLAQGMDRVRAVEMAISASNKATAGPAVSAAIAGQVGQPLRIWRGQHWAKAFGWQEMRSVQFRCAGTEAITGRKVALVDVPDLALLPERLAGRPAVAFRAGTELRFQNWALWLASWLVRWRLVATLAPLARFLHPLQSLTRSLGSDRSAMIVRLFGDVAGQKVERRWTLIADRGDGPEIPTLSVAPIVARILSGQEAAGARDAAEALTLSDYADAFEKLAIQHDTAELPAPPPLYDRIMGDRFGQLPPEVRAIHDVFRDGGAAGEATVTGASNPAAALIARIVGFPKAGTHRLHVHFHEADGRESWTRNFGGRRFQSHLSQRGRWLVERFGPFRFAFDLPGDAQGLTMIMRRWWIGPLPLPTWLAPRSSAREWAEGGRFHFDVPIALPLIGRLVHYRGWLEPATIR
ncbi:SDR family oxidoreductase [Sphingobium sp. SA916]|uniref:SDR family oxidoreductase n=1 Tax=Sphingobium sp. SA916 TaxID=1851207 RepID=UPI000C9EE530|nr:SDR family oxidoreductase [Sphingobium sp. SA916]PNP96210.1 saccharopine dehydrogenase [Sphingobium sp. SA916]